MTDTKFAEMLCTRFCHDIIGPIGAVSNGAEFLREEMPGTQSQALDLVEKSSREAVNRVQFYRQAYGIGHKTSNASLTEAKTAALGFFEGSKIELIWADKFTDMAPVQISYTQKKIILNLLILCTSILIRGGKVTFSIDDSKFEILAQGQTVKLDPEIEKCLGQVDKAASDEPKLVQAAYTKMLIDESGSKLAINKTNESLAFTVTKS